MITPLFKSLLDNSMFLIPLEMDNEENPLEGGEMESFLRTENTTKPKFKLQLDDKDVNFEELEDLLEYPRLNTVGELWLDRNEFGNKGVELLSSAEQLSGLRVLSLSGNKLTDHALSTLANSKALSDLKESLI